MQSQHHCHDLAVTLVTVNVNNCKRHFQKSVNSTDISSFGSEVLQNHIKAPLLFHGTFPVTERII